MHISWSFKKFTYFSNFCYNTPNITYLMNLILIILQPKASINLREAIFSMEDGHKTLNLPLKYSTEFSKIPLNYVVYGTVKGSVGVVATLPEKLHELLIDLQNSILADLPKGFGMNYNSWRSFKVRMQKIVFAFIRTLINFQMHLRCIQLKYVETLVLMDWFVFFYIPTIYKIQNLTPFQKRTTHEVYQTKGFVDAEVIKRVKDYSPPKLEKVLNGMSSLDKPSANELFLLIDTLTRKIIS